MPQLPILAVNDTILWLKVFLTAAMLVALYVRYRRAKTPRPKTDPFGIRVVVLLGVLFSFGVFHNLGDFRAGTFVHVGEMFHYYLGPKYFKELGYYELYNAVIAADTEQGNALAGLPFYTDLRTYKNTRREDALKDIDRVKKLFSKERWSEFKDDIAFFKTATGMPRSPGLYFLLMDHGYNGSPVTSFILGAITNVVPVIHLQFLALFDVVLEIAMGVLVFRTFGFEMGALFSIYFCVNVLNAYDFISGSLLRYDWLFYIVVAACLLEKRRHAGSAFFLVLSAMLRVFPAALLYGMAIAIVRRVKTTGAMDGTSKKVILTAGVTAVALFVLPAVSFGSVLQPWKEFAANTELHDRGVYVNHLGLRGMVLFEPSHLSLEKFVEAYKSAATDDIVRHWQDVKELEFAHKRPIIVVASLFILACLAAIIWKRKDDEVEGILWPLLLVYTGSYPAHYYYGFLCLFILLFFRRPNSIHAFLPLCLLMLLNIGALVTDYFRPSPIVFYTLVNIYLLLCLATMLGFELYANVLGKIPMQALASVEPPDEGRQDTKRRKGQRKRQGQGRARDR